MTTFRLLEGDCLDQLKSLDDNFIDSIVTDPPYGLGFMGKKWDIGVPAVDVFAECLRVLKPGGHLLAFGGSRTYHRLAVAVEDAGFEIRDQIMWVYGSGFPKSQNVSKAIDKAAGAEREVTGVVDTRGTFDGRERKSEAINANWREAEGRSDLRDLSKKTITAPATDAAKQWDGWGTALKPAHEPIVVARKPLTGTVAANVLAHGTGALNIDGCRIATDEVMRAPQSDPGKRGGVVGSDLGISGSEVDRFQQAQRDSIKNTMEKGRWPANLIHDGSREVLGAFPDAPGQQANISSTAPSEKTSNVYGRMRREGEPSADSDNGGAVGFKMKPGQRRLDKGSAARFFYCAKASKTDRTERGAVENRHPTVKPTDLMRYLCRLVTPPGGTVLDPFAGSGSTGKAAILEGFAFVGIEKEAEYLPIARARIEHAGGVDARAEIDDFDLDLDLDDFDLDMDLAI